MPIDDVQLSKFLSLVRHHKPDVIGLVLDSQGWAGIDDPLVKANAAGTKFGREDLLRIVAESDKKRFSLSPDADRIRAAGQRHGKPHIFKVDAAVMHARGFKFCRADNGVWLTDTVPPEYLVPVTNE
ncbi:RNA 2'-phosphotransferase [Bradyrhizobium zhanjiangense]|uniref:RNA 2'-phosphotransferase n=1 Tax=Bradyrhizobium zhanjiangense TaxID=1325107 RepID=A0A4Q0QFD1_9BRAD|nr:RNA 2'-phosphotransferase [Bradyrhizobium zhanjiangense]RXG90161.1 hypothetical protein EAS61_26700 [Bradyrhizobium zhanjiangense]